MQELKKVNVFCGRFQPFHLGHLKCCEDAFKENGYPTFIFYTPNKQLDARKPFDDQLIEKEYKLIVKTYDYVEGFDWMMYPQPTRMCRVLKEHGYEAVLWLCGEDRIDSYRKMLNEKGRKMITDEIGVEVPTVWETKRYGSATAVRLALRNDDRTEFNRLMPKCTHGMFDEFRDAIGQVKESRKSLCQFIKESLRVDEGGNSVEGCEPIRGDLAKPVSDEIIGKLTKKFGCKCAALGSVGKKGPDKTSGDIDIAIEYDWDDYKTVLDFVKNEFGCPVGNINNQLHVFNIGYRYDDHGTQKMVQVDFMFTDDVDFASFAYNSPDFTKNESRYKGMYQSALLMYTVSNTPVEEVLGKDYTPEYFTKTDYDGSYDGKLKSFWKLYFDQNLGLKVEHKTYEGKTKPTKNPTTIKSDTKQITKNIGEILKMCLGPKATKDTCRTFEKELAFICSPDYKFRSRERLESIKNDFLDDWQLKLKTDPALMKELGDAMEKEIDKVK